MKKIVFACFFILTSGVSLAQDSQPGKVTSGVACPAGYALHIAPPPTPTDDQTQPQQQKPMTALEKQQAEQQANQEEMSRWHCVPLGELHSQQEGK